MYHHSCDVNFRKRTKVGRPKNVYRQEAFLRMYAYFEDNNEEQLSLTGLANKMKEYLQDDDSVAYGNQYLKSKLLEHYGKSICIAEGEGLSHIVTFREKTSEILRNYFKTPNGDDEETEKRAIIEDAAKLIKSDIKTIITPSVEVWTVSAPVSSAYNYTMQEFCETMYTTSDQHKDASRMASDKEDFAKLAAKLDHQSPFSDEVALRNIITGINAGTNVNVQNLFIVGKDAVTNMEGQAVFSYSHKRTNAVKTLASTRAVTVDKERGIDPALLFQRFIVVSQSGDLCLEEVMKYELSPYPPSLFELKNLLRKPDKAPLLHAVRSLVNSSNDAILQVIPKTDHYVLDGGSLIHRLKWTDGSTYNSIADAYASFTVDVYGNSTVVLDGYDGGPSTNENAHQRRIRTKVTNKVDISDATRIRWKKG